MDEDTSKGNITASGGTEITVKGGGEGGGSTSGRKERFKKRRKKNHNQAWDKKPESTNNNNNNTEQASTQKPWDEVIRENFLYRHYYTTQLGFPEVAFTPAPNSPHLDNEGIASLFKTMTNALATTFWVNRTSWAHPIILHRLTTQFAPTINALQHITTPVGSHRPDPNNSNPTAPQFTTESVRLVPLSWYPPPNTAWHLSASRHSLRKHPTLNSLHRFLTAQADSGHINRQEAVSMLPPLLLDVRPHHTVIDLCAAPGSKTAQILNHLHSNPPYPGYIPPGVIIANDVDEKRCGTLVHQMKRFESPCVMVTNYPAQAFPWMKGFNVNRILCDVPCSGDGTTRKNFDVWAKWNPNHGLSLHKLQARILTRALTMLLLSEREHRSPDNDKKRLVYSTCSLNPIENEAVVRYCLSKPEFKGKFQIRDVHEDKTVLQGLLMRRGLRKWRVCEAIDGSKGRKNERTKANPLKGGNTQKLEEIDLKWYNSYDDVKTDDEKKRIPKSAFCDTTFEKVKEGEEKKEEEKPEVIDVHLERCVRIYPHDQDTGGFFVCAIEVVPGSTITDIYSTKLQNRADEEASASTSTTSTTAVEGVEGVAVNEDKEEENEDLTEMDQTTPKKKGRFPNKGNKPSKRDQSKVGKEEPFLQVSEPLEALFRTMMNFYHVDPVHFPRSQLLCRSAMSPNISLISTGVANILWNDTGKGWMKLIHTGVKLAAKYAVGKSPTDYRLEQEGLKYVVPHMTEDRVVKIKEEDFMLILKDGNPKFESFREEVRKELEKREVGSLIFKVEVEVAKGVGEKMEILLSGWRAGVSVYLLVNKIELKSMKNLLEGRDQEVKKEEGIVEGKLATAGQETEGRKFDI
eukprot:TRINITY_DN2647_c0_g1_i1.p1 TRINITY_DN2647_c0_g1~~TRINITY_DN2647_c0_g1_i1.p1  ORF type:complete len:857 (+),score=286.10 TRINITY_DN2647_c0_g1_i1:409-2979(+)